MKNYLELKDLLKKFADKDYEIAKEYIYAKMIHVEDTYLEEWLLKQLVENGVVVRQKPDCTPVIYRLLVVDEALNVFYEEVVTCEMLKNWGRTEEEIEKQAWINIKKIK